MVFLPGSSLSRHPDKDGATASLIETHFPAVALSLRKPELEKAVREHACNSEALGHWKMLIADIEWRNRRRKRGQSI